MEIEKINKSVRIDLKERLKQILPEVFEDNKVNFEELKALLNGETIEKEDDRFYFNWAGKNNLYKIIQTPAYGTLKPDREKSVDFDKTENIVIVGENLETLKLLLKPYFGKVKMIYIDPPYNTGKDFIYRDNFKEPVKDYLEKTGQIDSEGKKLTTNTEASGRYHSDWLNFIYPRLFLARSLLRDDGVIFVSIDDNEVHHLRMIMDEIFGEENFVANIIWHSKGGAGTDPKTLSIETEYILIYAKNKINVKLNRYTYDTSDYNLKDEYFEERGFYKLNKLDRKSLGYVPSLDFPIEQNGLIAIPGGTEEENKKKIWRWRWSKNKVEWGIKNGFIVVKKDKNATINAYYKIYEKVDNDGNPIERTRPYNNLVPDGITTSDGTGEIENIFGIRIMDYPKPTELMFHLIKMASDTNSLILDFFAGSGTTGHAVWDLNKEDGGNRKFILVQLDEEVQNEEVKKQFPTVADICIERLRRVSEKYKRENTLSIRDTPLKEGNTENSPSQKGWQAKPDRVVKWNKLPYNPDLKEKARELRKAGNLSEVLFWNQVKNKQFLGLDFDRQKIIGNYIVDFYCKNLGLIIEIEGESHNYKVDYDKKREEYLKSLGLKVIHILDIDVKKNLNGVMKRLKMEIGNALSHSPSQKGWQAKPDRVVANPPLKEGNDFGFKVFRLDKSNFNLKDEFEFDPSENKEELKKKYLEWLGMWVDEPLVSGWKPIDVIYEVMLKEGLNLNSEIEQVKIKENNFYYIKDKEQNLDFYINLEDKIDKDTIEEIRTPKFKGKTFVFLDKALTDSDKINLSTFVRLKVI